MSFLRAQSVGYTSDRRLGVIHRDKGRVSGAKCEPECRRGDEKVEDRRVADDSKRLDAEQRDREHPVHHLQTI